MYIYNHVYVCVYFYLQFHAFTCKWYNFIPLYCWIIVNLYHILKNPFISCRAVSIAWLLWIVLQ
jgi:hypothetical protein